MKTLWLPCSAAGNTITRVWKGIRGIRYLTKIQCGIREALTGYGIWLIPWIRDSSIFIGIDSGLGKKTLFRIAMTEVRDAGFSWEKSGNASGIRIPFSRPYITGWLHKPGWPVLPGSRQLCDYVTPSQPGYLESRSCDRDGVIPGWMLKGRPILSCLKPLLQSEAKCDLIFARKDLHLALLWKWEFLELGSGLFNSIRETLTGYGIWLIP